MIYEEFDTIEEVDNRIKNRGFIDFVINNEVGRSSKYTNGNKKYILRTFELPEPFPINNAREVKTIDEVNDIILGASWYELYTKNTGTFIVLWGTHRRFKNISNEICTCPYPGH